MRIWYGLGSGKYQAEAVMWAASEAFENEVHLQDVNRDGQLDFVRVSGSWVGYWLNDGRGSNAVQHGDFPGMLSMSETKKLLFADMNGNGSSDVVWITVDGGMKCLDLLEEPNVGLLSRVDEYSHDTIQNLITRKTTLTGGALQSELLEYGSAGGDGSSTGPNRVTKIGDKRYSYDTTGNLQQYNGFALSYDVEGRLIKAEQPGQKTLHYYYDPFGERRVLTVEQPGKEVEVYQYPFAEFELRNGIEVYRVDNAVSTVEVTRGPGIEIDAYLLDELTSYAANPVGKAKPLPDEYMDLNRDGKAFDATDLQVALAAYWNDELAGGERTVWRYQQYDQIGSVTSTIDSRADLVGASRYHPYGEVAERQGTKSTRGFAGSEVDPEEELGLIRMGARYYAPGLGRWITPDRFIGEQPLRMRDHPLEANLYSYAKNSPVALKDPDGQFAQIILGALLGAGIEMGVQLYQDGKISNPYKVLIAGAFGAATGGVSAVVGKAVVGGTLSAIGTRIALNTTAGAALGGLQEATNQTWGGDPKNDAKMGRAVLLGGLGGLGGSTLGEALDVTLGTAANRLAQRMDKLSTFERVNIYRMADTTRSVSRASELTRTMPPTAAEVISNAFGPGLGAADSVTGGGSAPTPAPGSTGSERSSTAAPSPPAQERRRYTREQLRARQHFYDTYGPKGK